MTNLLKVGDTVCEIGRCKSQDGTFTLLTVRTVNPGGKVDVWIGIGRCVHDLDSSNLRRLTEEEKRNYIFLRRSRNRKALCKFRERIYSTPCPNDEERFQTLIA